MLAFARLADVDGLLYQLSKRSNFTRLGNVAIGLEPGEPRRQLEQQRSELPLCQS